MEGPDSEEGTCWTTTTLCWPTGTESDFDWVMFHAASPEQRAKAAAYDDVMIPAIVKKFGSDVTDPAWKEACNATHAARAKYLAERRDPSTQPATRPAAGPPRSNTHAS